MWKTLTSTTSFTKKQRSGNIIALVVVIICCILPFLAPLLVKEKKYDHNSFEKEIALLQVKQVDSGSLFSAKEPGDDPPFFQPSGSKKITESHKAELFFFDPNTLDEEGWRKLGIRDKTIGTIKNYIAKGGRFRKAEDIGKIWGLSKEDAERIIPFVRLPAAENKAITFEQTKPAAKPEKKEFSQSLIDINTADTTALIALPGIGSKLSQRIINFRDKLGGFHSVEQVGETFGLPDSTFQKIKKRLVVKTASVKRINVNTATVDELKAHPYIRYAIGNAIVQYRNQHGNFSSVDELKKIMAVTEEVYSKALPYLSVD